MKLFSQIGHINIRVFVLKLTDFFYLIIDERKVSGFTRDLMAGGKEPAKIFPLQP